MPSNCEPLIETGSTSAENKEEYLKPYQKPELILMGDLRSLTLGSSPFDTPDSGFVGMYIF